MVQKSDNVERAHLLVEMAKLAEQLEETGKALSLYDDALSQFGEDSVDPFLAEVLRWKGTVHRERGETEAAFRCYTKSLEKARLIGSDRAQASALNCLGTVMACDAQPMSWVLNNLGILHIKIRNFGEARDYLERGLAIAVNRSDTVVENVIKLNLAEVWLGLGSLETADECCDEALDQAQKRGDHLTAAGALKIRAAIERQRGALDKSIATLRIAIYEAEEAEDRLLQAEMLRELGEISRAVGNAGAARSAWREAVDSYQTIGANQEVAEVQAKLGLLPS